MGLMGRLETKINYHYTLPSSQEESISRVGIELFFPAASTAEFIQR